MMSSLPASVTHGPASPWHETHTHTHGNSLCECLLCVIYWGGEVECFAAKSLLYLTHTHARVRGHQREVEAPYAVSRVTVFFRLWFPDTVWLSTDVDAVTQVDVSCSEGWTLLEICLKIQNNACRRVATVVKKDCSWRSLVRLGEQAQHWDYIWAADRGIVNRKSRDIPEEVGSAFKRQTHPPAVCLFGDLTAVTLF